MKIVDRDRYWKRVRRLGPDECWLWTGAKDADGYGKVKTPTIAGKRWILGAHRVAFYLANGEFDTSLCVLHRCDTPLCVNPAHLFIGTHADNAADRHAKGRTSSGAKHSAIMKARVGVRLNPLRGSAHPFAKLTDDKVRQARKLSAEGASHREMAAKFGVAHEVLGKAIRGETWSHVK